MKCYKIKKILSYEIDGRLDPDQENIVQEHIKTCSVCASEREELFKYRKIMDKSFAMTNIPRLSDNFDNVFRDKLAIGKPSLPEKIREALTIPALPARVFARAGVLVAAVVLAVVLTVDREPHLPVKEGIVVERNSDVFLQSVVMKAEEAQVKNTVDRQAKEILQNFL